MSFKNILTINAEARKHMRILFFLLLLLFWSSVLWLMASRVVVDCCCRFSSESFLLFFLIPHVLRLSALDCFILFLFFLPLRKSFWHRSPPCKRNNVLFSFLCVCRCFRGECLIPTNDLSASCLLQLLDWLRSSYCNFYLVFSFFAYQRKNVGPHFKKTFADL